VAGYTVVWQDYPMQHTVNEQELHDIQHWLSQQIKK